MSKRVVIHREGSKQDGKEGEVLEYVEDLVMVKTKIGVKVPCYQEELENIDEERRVK